MHAVMETESLGVEHAPGLMRLAYRLAGAEDAEDLVQATYVRALEGGEAVRERKSWLRQVLRNERRMAVRARLRREGREQAVAGPVDDPVDVEQVVHVLDVARVVRDLVDGLDDDVRLVVRERYLEGSSAADIARRHAIPAGTVRWRLKSGLDRLRDELDHRYGGRRALWAGALVPGPMSIAPTLSTPVASGTATAGRTSAAAGKGKTVMTAKLLLGFTLAAAGTAGAATWVVLDTNVDTPPPSPEAGKTETPPPNQDARERWAQRRAQIQAVHAAAAQPSPSDGEAEAHARVHHDDDAPCDGEPHVGMCTDDGCLERLASQVTEMIDGCEAFTADAPPGLRVLANVIGAPDVGTVVESVELSGGDEASEELRECLTESMYTLDLGPAKSNFQNTVAMVIGHGANLDRAGDVLGDDIADLDEATQQLVRDALGEIDGGSEAAYVMKVRHEDLPEAAEAADH